MILGISAGKDGGNTDIMVRAALEECKKAGLETKFLNIWSKEIRPCMDCGKCKTQDHCWQKDAMEEIQPLLEEADGFLIGSPTYFGGISGRLSMLFDRTLPLRRNGFKLRNKVGGALAVGGSRNGGQEFVVRSIQNWVTLHGGIVIADDAPTAHFGGIGMGRKSGDVAEDEPGMSTSKNLGKHLAEVVCALKD
jgi:multimeric flavodoxin WrbA